MAGNSIQRRDFGMTPQGAASLHTLEAGEFSASFCDFGATWVGFVMPDRQGRRSDILLGYDNAAGFVAGNAYLGATVGRFANRIAFSRFELGGTVYRLEANDGPHHLHGGRHGFSHRLWRTEHGSVSGNPSLRFFIASEEGDGGYPGRLEVMLEASLSPDGRILLRYEASTDVPTPVSLTNHAYFNLGGQGRGNILDHSLLLRSSFYLEVDDSLIPLRDNPEPVDGTAFDFRVPRSIGARIAEIQGGGYDHCFLLDEDCSGGRRCFAELRHEPSGRRMRASTDMPAVQFYTGNFLDGIMGKEAARYDRHSGLCLETGYCPDSPNRKDFLSCILAPGSVRTSVTSYEFDIDF
jgi:aldose 1-epimerase